MLVFPKQHLVASVGAKSSEQSEKDFEIEVGERPLCQHFCVLIAQTFGERLSPHLGAIKP